MPVAARPRRFEVANPGPDGLVSLDPIPYGADKSVTGHAYLRIEQDLF